MLILHEQLPDGNLNVVSNTKVSYSVMSRTFQQLKIKTEYIIEVKAGTVKGFGPSGVIHQRTSGEGTLEFS